MTSTPSISTLSRREVLQYSVLSTLYCGVPISLPSHANDSASTCPDVPYLPDSWTDFAKNVTISEDKLAVELTDGRFVSAPISWYPRLAYGTPEERNHWELNGDGIGIHWPDLDEDISVENLLRGQSSGESQQSLKRWLDSRKTKAAG